MTLLILDGNSILNRAFYGIKLLSTRDGRFTNGIYGFINILFSLTENYKPDAVAIAFDVRKPTFRHEMYDQYKGNRKGMPEELASQMPVLKELLTAMGYTLLECPGWEADDIIGTLSKSCKEGDFCYIATGDRDSLQLVDKRTNVLLAAPRGGKTETIVYDETKILQDKGVEPIKLIEVKALMGDASDNIPGVLGIGEKTAVSLVQKYGSIDYIYENIDGLELTKSVRNKLEAGKDMAFLSRKLGTIATNAPIDTDYSKYVKSDMDKQSVKALLTDLEMNKFIEKLKLKDVVVTNSVKEDINLEFKEIPYEEIKEKVCKEKKLYIIFDDEYKKAYINLGDCVTSAEFEDILPLLKDGSIEKYTHNCKALHFYTLSKGLPEVSGITFDTLLAGYLLNPNSSDYSVSALADSYRVNSEIDSETAFVKDAAVLRRLCEKLNDNIIENGEEKLLHEIEIPLSYVLSSMEFYGFKVDFQGIYDFGNMLEKRINDLVDKIYGYAGCEFNINSTKQLGTVLFDTLKLPVKKKTKTGYSTNAEVLESLRDEHPIIPDILEYRTLQKLKSTYCDGLLKVVSEDGRIHSTFRQTETRTGRLSSTEPNLQNIPVRTELGSEMRKFFISDKDKVLVDADYSQIELRVLAAVSDDKNMIDAFNNGDDIHAITASQVFNMPLEMVTPLMRSRAKAVNFGIVYGIGAFSLGKDIGVPVYEAKRYIDNYLNHYSGVNKYMENIVKDAKTAGYVKTLFNRRRYLPEINASNAIQRSFGERVARNMPIQGTAADIIKIAMVKVAKRLDDEKMNSRLIMQVHDELIIEAPVEESEKALKILKEEMENAVSLTVKLSVDAHIGKTWYEAKG
ncbi:MAG: DNA polymerase I [Clostridiales bacterium]|nr:DNA polymerase I [Clostridiales bacterium]